MSKFTGPIKPRMIQVLDPDGADYYDEKLKAHFSALTWKLTSPRWSLPGKERVWKEVPRHVRRTMLLVRNITKESSPLALLGETGSGKTCAALCVCDWAGDSIYVTANDLCGFIIDVQQGRGFARHDTVSPLSERDLWKDWQACNIAVLDEIGLRENVSDHHYGTVCKAIDKRVEAGLPLIVISNLSLEQIAKVYDRRVSSRLAGGTVVELTGDRRVRSNSAKEQRDV